MVVVIKAAFTVEGVRSNQNVETPISNNNLGYDNSFVFSFIECNTIPIVLPFQAHYGSGFESASNRNEYQESSLGKRRPARKADNLTAICWWIVYEMLEPRYLTTL
jgi:hypothetical protein